MSDIRRDEIIYEEGWRDHRETDAVEENAPIDEIKPAAEEEKSVSARPLLTMIQLVLCMMAVLVLFLLKAMDSEAYHSFMSIYAEEMAKPVISQKIFDMVDWNALLSADSVTVKATPDELSAR